MTFQRSLIVAAAILVSAGSAAGQALGDVAQREAARRKEVKAPGKVYTNDSLRGDTTAPPAPASSAPAASAPTTAPPATGAKDDAKAQAATAATTDTRKDEKYWKEQLTQARTNVDRAQAFAEALQSQINGLTADFTSRSDPAQRDQIFANRQKALAELDRVRKEIVDGQKAIADIQEEGRKAGVPAAWVR